MDPSVILSTFHAASFAPRAVRRRELTRTWLATVAVVAALGSVSVLVLITALGGSLSLWP